MHIKNIGINAENLVMKELRDLDFQVEYIDSWYDIRATMNNKQYLIEVKSTSLTILNGIDKVMYGRFDFTELKNRRKQRTHNAIIIFVVYIGDSYNIIGYTRAKTLNASRYVTLPYIMNNKKLKRLDYLVKESYL